MKYSPNQLLRDIDIISNGLDEIHKTKSVLGKIIIDADSVGEEVAGYLSRLEDMLESTELKERCQTQNSCKL